MNDPTDKPEPAQAGEPPAPGAESSKVGTTTRFDVATLRAAVRAEDGTHPVVTVIAGAQVGLTVPLGDATVFGRDPECDFMLNGRGISRQHLRVEREPSGHFAAVDLGSTNGVWVNGECTRRHTLADGDRIQLGPSTVLKFSVEDLTEISIRVRQYEQSIRDDLTGIHNRRHFMKVLEHEMAYASRHEEPLSVLLFDIDFFKSVNDRYGHQAGDHVIRRVAGEVDEHLREEDFLARYGGEEFAVLLRAQDGAGARDTAERLRAMVESLSFRFAGEVIRITVSVGVASLVPGRPVEPEALVVFADRCLYAAKAAGRNRVAAEPGPA